MEAEARAWIEAVIGEGPLEGTLQEALKSGMVLCNLINKIKPGTVKKINKMKMPFMQMENIAAYLTGCKELGVPDFESFQTVDLFEDSNMKAVVLNIHSLGRTAQKLGFAGPTLGVKESAGNKREFTEEQLNAGKNIVPTFGMGSHVSAQEDAKAKLRIAQEEEIVKSVPYTNLKQKSTVMNELTRRASLGGDDEATKAAAAEIQAYEENEAAKAVQQTQDASAEARNAYKLAKQPSFIDSTFTSKKEFEEFVKQTSAIDVSDGGGSATASSLPAITGGTPEAEARAWIEAVIGEGPLEGTLQEALKSGVVLCNLINKIKPGVCKAPTNKKLPFMQMENIAAYLEACRDIGIPDFESFQTIDLFEDQNMKAVVLNIHSLGRTAQKLGFAGPTLGVKESAGNKREFTEEQLNAGKNIVPTFGMGSHVSAQEDAKAKLQQ